MLRKSSREDPFADSPRQYAADENAEATVADYSAGDDTAADGGDSFEYERAARETRTQSVIDANSTFDGRFEAGQDLMVLGSLSGEVICRGLLTIERDATAKAKIEARDATIRGRLDGDVTCTGRLLIAANANVTGTLKAAALVVEEGAQIRGTVETANAPAAESGAQPGTRTRARTEPAADSAAAANGGSGRWSSRTREVPSFALVSSDDEAANDK
jgi:cytoskeletal protein CcmA (bactofilin family)